MAARGSHPVEVLTSRFRYLIVRTSVDPAAVREPIRRVVSAMNPQLPWSSVATVDELVGVRAMGEAGPPQMRPFLTLTGQTTAREH